MTSAWQGLCRPLRVALPGALERRQRDRRSIQHAHAQDWDHTYFQLVVDAPTRNHKPNGFLDRPFNSSQSVNAAGHPEPAHVALRHHDWVVVEQSINTL